METKDINFKIFIDQIGRTIIGDVSHETENTVTLKNPCTIFVQPNEQGQLQVQTVPLIFREFLTLDGREKGVNFTWLKSTIVECDAAENIDEKLQNQYSQIFANFALPDDQAVDNVSGDSEVVKLFDD